MSEKLSDAKAQVRELQTEVKELRKTLGGKAEQKDVAALDTRMDGYATQKDIESTRELLSSKIAQRAEDAATRSAKLEHVTGVDHAGRLVEIEKLLPTMHPSEDATANYATIDAELKRQHDVAEARHAEHSKKAEKLNGTADVRADEARLRLLPLLRPLLPPPAATRLPHLRPLPPQAKKQAATNPNPNPNRRRSRRPRRSSGSSGSRPSRRVRPSRPCWRTSTGRPLPLPLPLP